VQATKSLEGVASTLASQGARVRTFVRKGNPAEVILDIAAEEKATLIALSTHGRSGISRWTLGSVAEKIIRASRVPVLALRSTPGTGEGMAHSGAAELSLKRILVPLEASDLSEKIVAPTIELASLFGAHVALLHVCQGPECAVPVPQMTHAFERFREAGVSVEPVMRMGDAAVAILEACREWKADLVAMTTHARTGLSRWMLGSVTEKVLHASTVPLLIVRPSRSEIDRKSRSRGKQGVKV